MTIESVLTQLESLHAASTSGEWIWDSGNQAIETAYGGPAYRQDICSAQNCVDLRGEIERVKNYWEMEPDMDFIAAAHNHLPAVIAEVRRLQLTEAGMKRVIDIASRKLELQHAEVERMRGALTTIVDRADRTDIGWWAVSPYAYEVAKAALGESK